jgi:hypothetical protein
MQLSAIRTETRNLLDDVGADRWTDSDLNLYINQAQYDFNVLTQIYRGPVNVNLVAGQSVYAVSSNDIVGPIVRMEGYRSATDADNVNSTTQEKLDTVKFGWIGDAGATIPKVFMRSKNDFKEFQIYPKSLTTTTSGYPIIKVYAARVPTTLSADVDVPVIPVEYHHALPYGAAARALQRNNDALSVQLAQAYDAKFKEYVATAQAIAKASFI